MEIVELGLYILEDKYLNDYYLKDYPTNKTSSERPFFTCFKDSEYDEIYWVIPISSQVNKYIPIMNKYPNSGIILQLFGNKDSVLLIQNITPIHKDFFKRAFLVNNIPFRIVRKEDKKNILKKAHIMRSLIKHNKIYKSKEINKLYQDLIYYSKTKNLVNN